MSSAITQIEDTSGRKIRWSDTYGDVHNGTFVRIILSRRYSLSS